MARVIEVFRRENRCGIRGPVNPEFLRRVRDIPCDVKWVGRDVFFEPTSAALEHVKQAFPEAQWDVDSSAWLLAVQCAKDAAPPALRVVRDYVYKTEPYQHQHDIFLLSRDLPEYGLFWEMGLGKTKLICDTAAWLWGRGKIQALLVIAFPNGVHRNWVTKEVPAHLPDYVPRKCVAWNASKPDKQCDELFSHNPDDPCLLVLTMNVEALSSARGAAMAAKFCRAFKALLTIDESTSIKAPGAKRTEVALKLGKLVPYRRIMSGTPVTKWPLDLWAQLTFLSEFIHHCGSFYAFRSTYAVMKALPGKTSPRGQAIKIVVGFKDLDKLTALIKPHTSRLLKDDCLDLPPKLYRRLPVELSKEQRRIYMELRENMMVEYKGRTIAAPLAMNLLQRLHQVVLGFLPQAPGEDSLDAVPIDGPNPRLEDFLDDIEQVDGKSLVWVSYRYTARQVVRALSERYGEGTAAGFTGATPADKRPVLVDQFEDGNSKLRFLVGNKAMAYGWTLLRGRSNYYYSNSYELEVRLQSEDRPHRIGQKRSVTNTDVECEGTVDSRIIRALRDKREIASVVLGDSISEWLA